MHNRPTAPRDTRQVPVERHAHQRAAARSVRSDRIRVTVLEQADSDALLDMAGRCSATTLYRRFHGVTDGVRYAQQLLADAADHDSYAAWNGDRCVGIGNLHVCEDTAEIGVLVEDGWQRRGVGSALVAALVRRARQHRTDFLRADLLAENQFVLQTLARVGPLRTRSAPGSYTALIDIRPGSAPAQTPSVTTPGATLPVQTVHEAVAAAAATTRFAFDDLHEQLQPDRHARPGAPRRPTTTSRAVPPGTRREGRIPPALQNRQARMAWRLLRPHRPSTRRFRPYSTRRRHNVVPSPPVPEGDQPSDTKATEPTKRSTPAANPLPEPA